ncbi:MAG: tetratricopeptide repeat protein [Planctomycetota bacterium]
MKFMMGGVVAAGLLAGAGLLGMQLLRPAKPTLDEGLRRVEHADAEGVDRIEQALLRSGARDEAAVVRCAWLVRRARYQQALNGLTPDMIAGPLNRHVLRLAGECLFHLGELDRAESLLVQLVAEHPDEVDAHRVLAAMYYDLGSPDLALKALNHVIRLAPLDYRPHHLTGVILMDNENFVAAAKQFRLGLSKTPPEEPRRVMQQELAKVLIRLRDFPGALDSLSDTKPSPDTDTQRAECFWSLGDARQAAQLVDEVLANHPEHVNALKLKARFIEEAGEGELAVPLLQKVLVEEPFDLDARYQLLQLYGALGKNEERATEQIEYNRYRGLQDRLIELNQQASSDPNAEAPRRELVKVCQALGRQKLAAMWHKAAEFCARRQQSPRTPGNSQPATGLKP